MSKGSVGVNETVQWARGGKEETEERSLRTPLPGREEKNDPNGPESVR